MTNLIREVMSFLRSLACKIFGCGGAQNTAGSQEKGKQTGVTQETQKTQETKSPETPVAQPESSDDFVFLKTLSGVPALLPIRWKVRGTLMARANPFGIASATLPAK